MNKRLGFVFVALMAVPVALLGQEKPRASSAPPAQSAPPANPITASEKGFYSFVSSAVVGAAQKMPEENYSKADLVAALKDGVESLGGL